MCVFVFMRFGLVLKLLQPNGPLKELATPLSHAMQPPRKPNITYTQPHTYRDKVLHDETLSHSLAVCVCVSEYPACKPVCMFIYVKLLPVATG